MTINLADLDCKKLILHDNYVFKDGYGNLVNNWPLNVRQLLDMLGIQN